MKLDVFFCTVKNKWFVEASTSRFASLFLGEGDTKEDAVLDSYSRVESLNRQLYELEQELGLGD